MSQLPNKSAERLFGLPSVKKRPEISNGCDGFIVHTCLRSVHFPPVCIEPMLRQSVTPRLPFHSDRPRCDTSRAPHARRPLNDLIESDASDLKTKRSCTTQEQAVGLATLKAQTPSSKDRR